MEGVTRSMDPQEAAAVYLEVRTGRRGDGFEWNYVVRAIGDALDLCID